jgi:hypothetical protein
VFSWIFCRRSIGSATIGGPADHHAAHLIPELFVAGRARRDRHRDHERVLRQLALRDQIATHRRRAQLEHDVVHLHVEVLLDRADVGERDGRPRHGAPRSDLGVERQLRHRKRRRLARVGQHCEAAVGRLPT